MDRLTTSTKDELYDLARVRGIEGRSSMDKEELIAALQGDGDGDGDASLDALERSTTSSRPIWKGAITFGLVTVPIGLYTAVEDRDVSFHLLTAEDGSRVRYKRVAEGTDDEVDWDDIVRGFEFDKGRYVTFSDEELEGLQPPSASTVDIEQFVRGEEVDPLYFERSYYVAPEPEAVKAYRLLADALESSGRVGVATVTIRTKERLCVLRPREGMLVMETMHWPDEIRIPQFEQLDSESKISPQEMEMARSLIDQLTADFEPTRFRDRYREQIMAAVQQKIEGEEVRLVSPVQPEATVVTDLLETLRASVDKERERRSA